jgi:hypothetical protein
VSLPTPTPESAALVTGASSGIGADLARSLARRGHGVVLVARRAERLSRLAAELADAHGVRVETLTCDLSDRGARDAMLERLDGLGLRVDVLINNAGFGTAGLFQRLDGERETELVRLNCEAVVALCGRFVPGMVERGAGALLNVASTAGFQPLPTQATYSASKVFVVTFTEALSVDLSGTGVTATALCPGPVRTEFADVAGLGQEASRLPEPLWTTSADVAEAGVAGLERGKRIVVPGIVNRATAMGGRYTLRPLFLALARRVYRLGDS